MIDRSQSVIVALDNTELSAVEILGFAKKLSGSVWGFKVHSLLDIYGPDIIMELKPLGKVFVDMKIHDIPKTMSERVRAYMRHGADLVTVHATAGEAGLRAACEAGGESVAAVTQLTSDPDASHVYARASLAYNCGIRAIVCSAHEARTVKSLAPDCTIITPGIRRLADPKDDQSRTATADEAFNAGADLVVIGRPITNASDPLSALTQILSLS
jgi:orotidine-5'-phosphate decarboxylase